MDMAENRPLPSRKPHPRIRSVLGDDALSPRYIETLPRRGYRFVAPVKRQRPFVEPTPAVLPFGNLNGDPAKEYFADGVTDALITELARIRTVRVISRQSVLHLKGSSRKLDEIARFIMSRVLRAASRACAQGASAPVFLPCSLIGTKASIRVQVGCPAGGDVAGEEPEPKSARTSGIAVNVTRSVLVIPNSWLFNNRVRPADNSKPAKTPTMTLLKPYPRNTGEDASPVSPKGHANADLPGRLRDKIRHHPVEAQQRKGQGHDGEYREK
jgi:hypothetical protein